MKKRMLSLDVIRGIAIWMIVIFHFCCANNLMGSFFCIFQNGTWGCVGTTIFFMLSGFLMRQCNSNITSVFKFYKKRALSIYPMLFITFIGAYLVQSILQSNFFYGGNPLRIIFSFLGVDGYLSFYGMQTYYVVGEWFTAMIVMLYILFPLLNKLFEKNMLIGTLLFAALYLGNIFWGFQNIVADASIFTAIFLFWIGMVLQKYVDKIEKNLVLCLVLLVLSSCLIFIKLSINALICQNGLGVSLFLIMLYMFRGINAVDSNKWYVKTIVFISESSFAVYLSHHFIMNKVAGWLGADVGVGINLIITVCAIIIVSVVLFYIDKHFVKRLVITK